MKKYVYNTRETALEWIGQHYANHCWITNRITTGRLIPTKIAIKKYLQENMAHSADSSAEGRYYSSSTGVTVYSQDSHTAWEFSWAEITQIVIETNKLFFDEKLPIPINSTYFKSNFSPEEGFGVIANWLLRCHRLDLDFLISKKEVELTKSSLLEKILEYQEKNFFVGRQYLNLETFKISYKQEIKYGEAIPEFKQIEVFYSPDGEPCAYAHTTPTGVEYSNIETHKSTFYPWERLAEAIVANKTYLLKGEIQQVERFVVDVTTKDIDNTKGKPISSNTNIIEEKPISLTKNINPEIVSDFKEVPIKAILEGSSTLSQLSLF